MTRFLRWLCLPAAERRRVTEAVASLILAAILLRILPFRRVASILGDTTTGSESAMLGHRETAAAVARAVARAHRGLPWQSTCLVQALAGRLMLGRRAVPCTVHFGVEKSDTPHGFAAHAWLCAADIMVTGEAPSPRYTPIAAFAHRIQG